MSLLLTLLSLFLFITIRVLQMGAAFGRLVGEVMALIFPSGVSSTLR